MILYIYVCMSMLDESDLETTLASVFNWYRRQSFWYHGALLWMAVKQERKSVSISSSAWGQTPSVSRTRRCCHLQKLHYTSRDPGEIIKSLGPSWIGVCKTKLLEKVWSSRLSFPQDSSVSTSLVIWIMPWQLLKSPLAQQPLLIFWFRSFSKVGKS